MTLSRQYNPVLSFMHQYRSLNKRKKEAKDKPRLLETVTNELSTHRVLFGELVNYIFRMKFEAAYPIPRILFFDGGEVGNLLHYLDIKPEKEWTVETILGMFEFEFMTHRSVDGIGEPQVNWSWKK